MYTHPYIIGVYTFLDFPGLILLLEALNTGTANQNNRRLCVATTHLLFNTRRGDVKIAQLAYLLAALDKMAFGESISGITVSSGLFSIDFTALFLF